MKIKEFLSINHIKIVHAESRKQAMEVLSQLLSSDLLGITEDEIFDALLARERLGSTAMGHGIAFPHTRITALRRPQIALLKLEKGVDFRAPDHEPVDLFLAILVPGHKSEHHLELLAHLAEVFAHTEKRHRLRSCMQVEELFNATQELLGEYELPDDTYVFQD